MSMLVRIEMRDRNTRAQNLLDLRPKFLVRTDLFSRNRDKKIRHSRRQVAERRCKRIPADQHQVRTDIQSGILPRTIGSIVKLSPIRHQSSGSENAVPMRFDNTPIYVACETKIVCIDDQLLQSAKPAPGGAK